MTRRPPSSTLFPSRRSSDLLAAVSLAHRGGSLLVQGRAVTRTRRHRVGSTSCFAHVRSAHPRGRADRKSTRLNSSHLGISYAVFCLQKKRRNKTLRHVQT